MPGPLSSISSRTWPPSRRCAQVDGRRRSVGGALRHGLGRVSQQVHDRLLDLIGRTGNQGQARVIVPPDQDAAEVVSLFEVEVRGAQGHGLVQQGVQVHRAGGGLPVSAELQHAGDDPGRADSGLADVLQAVQDSPVVHEGPDGLERAVDPLRLSGVHRVVLGQPPQENLDVLQHPSQRVVDLVGHAGGQAPQATSFFPSGPSSPACACVR